MIGSELLALLIWPPGFAGSLLFWDWWFDRKKRKERKFTNMYDDYGGLYGDIAKKRDEEEREKEHRRKITMSMAMYLRRERKREAAEKKCD